MTLYNIMHTMAGVTYTCALIWLERQYCTQMTTLEKGILVRVCSSQKAMCMSIVLVCTSSTRKRDKSMSKQAGNTVYNLYIRLASPQISEKYCDGRLILDPLRIFTAMFRILFFTNMRWGASTFCISSHSGEVYSAEVNITFWSWLDTCSPSSKMIRLEWKVFMYEV